MKTQKNDLSGILWAISSCFFVAIMVGIVRQTSTEFHVTQILMMRCFFSVILFTPLIVKTNGKIFQTKKLKFHLFRSITGFTAMLMWFYTVTQLPLPEAVSITFIVPIITTLAAVLIFKEIVTKRLWMAIILGFIGVLIIIRPGFHQIVMAHILSLIVAVFWSFSNIITKELTKTDKPQTVALYVALLIFIMSVPAATPYLKAMTLTDLIWFFFLGLSANLAHISLSIAYAKTDLSILQPFDFTRLIFISIIAYFAFDELVDIYMLIGSAIIIFSSFYLSLSKRRNVEVISIKS